MLNWLSRFEDKGTWAPIWLGIAVAAGALLMRCAIDAIFLFSWGFPDGVSPLWRSDLWWPEIVNAVLLGYIPAVLVISRRGIGRDLVSLAPVLTLDIADVRAAATHPTGYIGHAFKLVAIGGGVAIVFLDPSATRITEHSLNNPQFIWPLLRIPVFLWCIANLIIADLIATRTYLNMGRNLIEVDLLDVQVLSPFARRGLRSALMWVVFSLLFSLFWLGGDTASQQNPYLLAILLSMAVYAFVVPLVGAHGTILAVKNSELDRLRDEIRIERAVITEKGLDEPAPNAKLANLIAYFQLIKGVREWPINAAGLLKFFLYLFIGLGSWLGGAVVELLLDRTLSG
jgi:hypothetical protein